MKSLITPGDPALIKLLVAPKLAKKPGFCQTFSENFQSFRSPTQEYKEYKFKILS